MLAPAVYKTWTELGITEAQWTALVKTQVGLETGEVDDFDLGDWDHCVLAQCKKFGAKFPKWNQNEGLADLFVLGPSNRAHDKEHAAQVIKDYLLTGTVTW